MKISNSKKELARIISENGGWFDGAAWAVQNGGHGRISFSGNKPVRHGDKSMGREDLIFNSHHGSIVFGRSCVVLRGDDNNYSKVMPCGNSFGCIGLIVIRGFRKAILGGVDGATGVCLGLEGSTVARLSAKRY